MNATEFNTIMNGSFLGKRMKFCTTNGNFLHNDNGPAIICRNGIKEWYSNGKLHREGGPSILREDPIFFIKEYYIEGKRHRENGPAVERRDIREWWINGKRHRIDGPAIVSWNGWKQFWIDGKLLRTEFKDQIWVNNTN